MLEVQGIEAERPPTTCAPYIKKSYKLRYVATKSIYISEKISKFALRTNKFLLIWKI